MPIRFLTYEVYLYCSRCSSDIQFGNSKDLQYRHLSSFPLQLSCPLVDFFFSFYFFYFCALCDLPFELLDHLINRLHVCSCQLCRVCMQHLSNARHVFNVKYYVFLVVSVPVIR